MPRVAAHGDAVRDAIHLVTPRAGAPEMRIIRRRGVATFQAGEGILRLREHGLEFAAQYTIGTADDLLRHSCLSS